MAHPFITAMCGFGLWLTWVARLPSLSEAVTGVDVSSPVSESEWTCLQSSGGQGAVEFAIVRVYRSSGSVDPNGAATIKAARRAGIKNVDGYIFPCVSCGNPASQVNATKQALDAAGASFGMFWLDIERYAWSSDKTANQKFIQQMVDACASLGVRAGVYSNWNSWGEIVGSDWSYASHLPLWYPHYDKNPSYSDFQPFGGWQSASIKQYIGDSSSCGASIDYNWYPSTH